jgi:DNA-binding transcriptional LysR family regulator
MLMWPRASAFDPESEMEMHQIRYFLAVARTLNFTRAAQECSVSQPALTRAIQQLEDELSGKLLRREGKLSHLTELGERMLPLVQQCYESALAAKVLATSLRKGASQVLSLALSDTIAMHLLSPGLSELQRVSKGLQLKITRGPAEEIGLSLKKGQSELAVAGPLGQNWDRLDSWPLFEEKLMLTLPPGHRLAGEKAVDLGQLARERLLVASCCESAAATARVLDEHGIAATQGHHLASQHDLLALLQAGLGVAFLPQTAIDGTGLRQLPVPGLEMSRQVSLYAVAGRQRSPAGEALLRLLRARDWSQRPG